MHAHTDAYVRSAKQSTASAKDSISGLFVIIAMQRKHNASCCVHSMKPMRQLSHFVFITRCSS